MNLASTDRVRFGIFEFDRLNRLLYRDGAELTLPPRAVGVLACLIDRWGQVVSKQDLLDAVWKDANVTETSLAEAVSLLRQTLSDDSQRPTFIQTLPRRGYRFVHPLDTVSPPGAALPDVAQPGATLREAPASDAVATAPIAATVNAAATIARPLPDASTLRVWPEWLPWTFVLGIGLALAIVLFVTAREPSRVVRPVTRFTLSLPSDLTLATGTQSVALSNDGRRAAIVASRNGGGRRLFVREMDQIEPVALADTDDAAAPFFSPDGQWVGFFARGQLRKTPVAGGPVETLCPAPHPFGAAWSPDGTIVFAALWTGGLQRVSDRGGEPETITTPDPALGEVRHAWPDLLPDGRGVIFAGLTIVDAPEAARVAVLSRDGRTIQTLFESATFPRFVATGHLLFTRGDAVFAAPFDPSTLEALGSPVPVLDTVSMSSAPGAAQFAATRAGSLIAATASAPDMPEWLRWVDTEGSTQGGTRSLGWPFPARRLRAIAANAAGTRVAASLGDGHRADIWFADLRDGVGTAGAATRLTSSGQNVSPSWAPDDRLVFSARRDGAFNLFAKSMDDDAAATRLTSAETNQFVTSAATPAGIVYVNVDARTGADLWQRPWSGGGAARPLARSPRDEIAGALSPDGRWLAYQVDDGESGSWDIVIRAADREQEEPVRVATGDGVLTAWAPDGRALFFSDRGRIYRLPLLYSNSSDDERPPRAAGEPMIIDDGAGSQAAAASAAASASAGLYAISGDGRVLLVSSRAPRSASRLEMVLEWGRELSAKVPVQPPTPKPVK